LITTAAFADAIIHSFLLAMPLRHALHAMLLPRYCRHISLIFYYGYAMI